MHIVLGVAGIHLTHNPSVIIDAVHARPADRAAIERVARSASVPFVGLWLEAPESLLIERTGQRSNDPSDADAIVVRMQKNQDTGPVAWHRLDGTRPAASVLSAALDHVQDHCATFSGTRLA